MELSCGVYTSCFILADLVTLLFPSWRQWCDVSLMWRLREDQKPAEWIDEWTDKNVLGGSQKTSLCLKRAIGTQLNMDSGVCSFFGVHITEHVLLLCAWSEPVGWCSPTIFAVPVLKAPAGTRGVHAHHSRAGDSEGDEGEVLLCGSRLRSWAESGGAILQRDGLHHARRTDCHSQHREVQVTVCKSWPAFRWTLDPVTRILKEINTNNGHFRTLNFMFWYVGISFSSCYDGKCTVRWSKYIVLDQGSVSVPLRYNS